MAVQLFAGQRSLADIDASARMGEWGEGIAYLYRDIYIFTAISTRLRREVVEDPEFNFYESDAPPMRCSADGQHAANAQQITVKSSTYSAPAKMFRKNIVIRVGSSPVSGELMLVTANPTSDTVITVARGKFGTTAATIADNAALTIVGSVSADGAGAPNPVGIEPYKVTNYCQIMRRSYAIDKTLAATKTKWGISETRRRKQMALEQHLLDREMTLLTQEAYQETDGDEGTQRRLTRGIIPYLVTNRLDGSGSNFTYANFKAWALPLSDVGKPTKTFFVGGTLFAAIQAMVEKNSTLMMTPGETKFGVRVNRLMTPGPDLDVVKHPLLTKYYPGTGIALDLSELTLCTMRDEQGVRDLRHRPNIQAPDADAETGEYLSHIGLKLGKEKASGVIYDVTVYTHA